MFDRIPRGRNELARQIRAAYTLTRGVRLPPVYVEVAATKAEERRIALRIEAEELELERLLLASYGVRR